LQGDGTGGFRGGDYAGETGEGIEVEGAGCANDEAGMGWGTGDEIAGGAGGDDAALMKDGDAVAEGVGFLDVMGGEEDGTTLGAGMADGVVQIAADLGIEAAGGLVEEEEGGIVYECKGKGETLALAGGEGFEAGIGFVCEGEAVEELRRRDGAGVECGEEVEGFARGDGVLEGGGLEDGADGALDGGGMEAGVEAGDVDGAGIGKAKAKGTLEEGGFAGAVGTEKAEDFAGEDVEGDGIDGADGAVGFDQVADGKAGFGGFHDGRKLESVRKEADYSSVFLVVTGLCSG